MKHILTQFYETPWAIMPESLSMMSMIIQRWAGGIKLTETEIKTAIGNDPEITASRHNENNSRPGHVAVLPLYGIISNRIHQVQDISGSGGISTEGFIKRFNSVVNDPSVGAIVIDIDSPGGSVHGVQEAASEIFNARGEKKIVAVANSLAASAAYWIGSAAEEFIATPSADIGSIGVIMAHEDMSEFVNKPEAAQIVPRVEFITAGEFKAEGNPFEPLSEDARAFMQSRVDEYYKDFIDAIAMHRGVKTQTAVDDFGQGRVFGAKQAQSAGMIDRIDTLDNVIASLSSSSTAQTPKSRAMNERKIQLAERI